MTSALLLCPCPSPADLRRAGPEAAPEGLGAEGAGLDAAGGRAQGDGGRPGALPGRRADLRRRAGPGVAADEVRLDHRVIC